MQLRAGDELVVTRLDRVGRSVAHLIEVVSELGGRGVELVVLDQGIDTTSPGGRLLFHVLAAMSEFVGDLISENTRDGLAAARAQLEWRTLSTSSCVMLGAVTALLLLIGWGSYQRIYTEGILSGSDLAVLLALLVSVVLVISAC